MVQLKLIKRLHILQLLGAEIELLIVLNENNVSHELVIFEKIVVQLLVKSLRLNSYVEMEKKIQKNNVILLILLILDGGINDVQKLVKK